MKYILTLYNKNSSNYGTSLWHSQNGTNTLICDNGAMAISIAERYMFGYKSVERITISRRDGNDKLHGWMNCFRGRDWCDFAFNFWG